MKLRKYTAPNVTQALEEIQRDLGPDALVVSVRQLNSKLPWQFGKKVGVEVIALASDSPDKFNNQTVYPNNSSTYGQVNKQNLDYINMIKSLTHQKTSADKNKLTKQNGQKDLNNVKEKLDGEKKNAGIPDDHHLLKKIQQRLINHGIDEPIVKKLISSCVNSLSPQTIQNLGAIERHLQIQLEAHLRFSSLSNSDNARWIFFVGMSGCGKTSSLLNIAILLTRVQKEKVHWICANTVKASSITEAKIYTENLGIPLHLVYTSDDLHHLDISINDNAWMLVDTPACNPHNVQSIVELGGLLDKIPKGKIILVAAATSKYADLNQIFTSLTPFGLDGLIITKMDETSCLGDVFNLAWYSHLPLYFFSIGPEILEHYQTANSEFLTRRLLNNLKQ